MLLTHMQNIAQVKMLQYQRWVLVHFHNSVWLEKLVIIRCYRIEFAISSIRLFKERGLYNQGQVSKSKYKEHKFNFDFK